MSQLMLARLWSCWLAFTLSVADPRESEQENSQPRQGTLARLQCGGPVSALLFSQDQEVLISATDHTYCQWHTRSWKAIHGPSRIPENILQEHLFFGLYFFSTKAALEKGNALFLPRSLDQKRSKVFIPQIVSSDGKTHIQPLEWNEDVKRQIALSTTARKEDVTSQKWGIPKVGVYRRDNLVRSVTLVEVCDVPIVSADGKFLAWMGQKGNIFLTNTSTRHTATLNKKGFSPNLLAFSPNGKHLVSTCKRSGAGDENIAVWNTLGAEIGAFQVENSEPLLFGGSVKALAFSPDAKTLAMAFEGDERVYLVEFLSGKIRCLLAGHERPVLALAFSPCGRMLGSGSLDKTILIWDLENISVDLKSSSEAWSHLDSADAAVAFRAIRTLIRRPAESVSLIQRHVKPIMSFEKEQILNLIENLKSAEFKRREEAFLALQKMQEVPLEELTRALVRTRSFEHRRRIARLIANVQPFSFSAQNMRLVRSVEILERIATEDAIELLHRIAEGAREALLTQQAMESLSRLDSRQNKKENPK